MTDIEREAYEQKMNARLLKWDAQMQVLKARAKEAGANAKAEIGKELDDLEKRSDVAREKLRELRNSSGEAWQDLKAGLDNSWRSLQGALEAAKSRFK